MKEPESIHPDCEIVTTRIVNAPRAIAYKAWSDPNHLKNWWGPAGFTNTFPFMSLNSKLVANGVLPCMDQKKEIISTPVNSLKLNSRH